MWKALRDELARSEWLDASDDLTTQRGIVVAALAIVDRMSNSEALREVSWRPVRLVAVSSQEGHRRNLPKGVDGGASVQKPVAAPRAPMPGPAYAEITF